VPSAIDELERLGLLHNQVALPGSRGTQSRFCATSALIEAARPSLIFPPANAPTVIYEPGELIRLKNSDGSLVNYDDTRRTEAMRREMREINEALRATDVALLAKGVSREGPFLRIGEACLNQSIDIMHRVFNRGSFSFGGRRYGPWWLGQRPPFAQGRGVVAATVGVPALLEVLPICGHEGQEENHSK
jgi:hypothetical protein